MTGYYAHSLKDRPCDEWQLIETHLKQVAEKAGTFARDFKAEDWAYLAGLWHDIGKYSEDFQKRINAGADINAHIENSKRPDHSTAGAKHAFKALGEIGKILAYAIAGHHAGLPNGKANEESCLMKRLDKKVPDHSVYPDEILKIRQLNSPFKLQKSRCGFQMSFFIRMLYSCLVDADFLDTERFVDKEKAAWREGYPTLEVLYEKLTKHLEKFADCKGNINQERAKILQHCLDAAEKPQGLFSLAVPTGGGKTLSSLAFAMKHAIQHGLKRIIYVIPYTSIIEQNAGVFREILGEDAVLEHHSNFEAKEEDQRSRLASENWGAPLVVTTNVQFFESLFHNRSSRCRKIHNIVNSVVILDEAQMIPVPLLMPCIEALRELSLSYRTTIVLCTATQPALDKRDNFKGLENIHPIIPDPPALYKAFKRVETSYLGELSDDDIASKLSEYQRVLCVVNTRKHARLLYEKIGKQQGTYHLSALMCPAHRSEKLQEIRKALDEKKPCRVVSTQLVEAGVDIDFPVVYRSAAGIDSIAQAAGRCNREGRLEKGDVFVFTPEEGLPAGEFRLNAQIAEMVMPHHQDLLSLEAVREYFERLYWQKGQDQLDKHGILKLLEEDAPRGNFPFREVAEKFQLIEDKTESIVIPWDDKAKDLISSLRHSEYPMSVFRKLQRYTVQAYPDVLRSLEIAKVVERVQDQYCVLIHKDLYRDDLGLCPEDPTFCKVESLTRY